MCVPLDLGSDNIRVNMFVFLLTLCCHWFFGEVKRMYSSATQETYLTRHMAKHSQENVPKIMTRPIKQEPMDLVDRDFIGARLPDRSTPSDLSMTTGGVTSCSKGSAPSSAFMPLSPFAANTVSSSSGPGYHYRLVIDMCCLGVSVWERGRGGAGICLKLPFFYIVLPI